LIGSNLFLATSFAATQEFDNATDVPPDFTGTELTVPHPAANGILYLKLRDDPATIQSLVLPVMPLSPTAAAPSIAQPAEPPMPPTSQPAPQKEPAPSPANQAVPHNEPAAPAKTTATTGL
jgi:hypothetical protein